MHTQEKKEEYVFEEVFKALRDAEPPKDVLCSLLARIPGETMAPARPQRTFQRKYAQLLDSLHVGIQRFSRLQKISAASVAVLAMVFGGTMLTFNSAASPPVHGADSYNQQQLDSFDEDLRSIDAELGGLDSDAAQIEQDSDSIN
jgi:hypothetical protein